MVDTEGDEERGRDTGGVDTGRVLALSDGVFAIASTLLVLDLRLPTGLAEGQLGTALRGLAPAFLSYAVSYALIGLFWWGHHAQFRRLERLSVPVVLLNLLLLGMVTLMPFNAQLLSRYGDERLAPALYAANMAAVLILEAAIGAVALRRGDAAPDGRAEEMVVRPLLPGAVFLVSVVIALVTTASAAEWSWLSLVVVGQVRRAMTARTRCRAGNSAD